MMFEIAIICIYSLIISSIYFLIRSRRTLYDLLLNTYVISEQTKGISVVAPGWQHLAQFVVIIILISILSLGISGEMYSDLILMKNRVVNISVINYVNAISYDDEENEIEIEAVLKEPLSSAEPVARQVASTILEIKPVINNSVIEKVNVTAYYGYDLRIFKKFNKAEYLFDQDDI